jgi:hypothetical protein
LFIKDELVGILDFGDINIGVPEQELRQLYRINDVVLDSAIKAYEEISGYKLNRDAIVTWAIAQELSVYSEMLEDKYTSSPSFLRAVDNLQKWLPEGDWRLIKESALSSKQ